MRMHCRLFFALVMSQLVTSSAISQTIVTKEMAGEGKIMLLRELAVIITEVDGMLKVENLLPTSSRPEEYREIDVKKNDEILMINARRVTSVEDIKKVYEDLEIGQPLKMGVRRGEEMFIIEIKKFNPEKLPRGNAMIIRRYEPGLSPATGGDTKMATQQMIIENADGSVRILPGTGLLFKVAEQSITISHVLPIAEQILGSNTIKEGDVLEKMNGVKIESFDQLRKLYDDLEIGADVTFTLKREEGEITANFKKPKAQENIIIKGE